MELSIAGCGGFGENEVEEKKNRRQGVFSWAGRRGEARRHTETTKRSFGGCNFAVVFLLGGAGAGATYSQQVSGVGWRHDDRQSQIRQTRNQQPTSCSLQSLHLQMPSRSMPVSPQLGGFSGASSEPMKGRHILFVRAIYNMTLVARMTYGNGFFILSFKVANDTVIVHLTVEKANWKCGGPDHAWHRPSRRLPFF